MKNLFILLICLSYCKKSYSQANPSIDTSFGEGGFSTHNFYPNYPGGFTETLPLDNGRILCVGESNYYGLSGAVRFDNNGEFDMDISIKTTGRFIVDKTVKKNGSIYMSGQDGYFDFNGSFLSMNPIVLKLNGDGFADSSFGNTGIGVARFGNTYSNYSKGIVVQDDGSIFVCTDSSYFPLIYKLQSNGILDSSFGLNGVLNLGYSYPESLSDFTVDGEGKFLLCFEQSGWPPRVLFLRRYNLTGNIDSAYGINGVFNLDIAVNHFAEKKLVITQDEVLIAGEYLTNEPNNTTMMMLVGVTQNGTLDSSFGINGFADLPAGYLGSVIIQQSGKILIACNNPDSLLLIRLNSNGAFDNLFGTDGTFVIDTSRRISSQDLFQVDSFLFVCGKQGISIPPYPMGVLTKLRIDFSTVTVNSFNIFPNPSSGEFNIQLNLLKDETIFVQLFDINGRLVSSQNDLQFLSGRNQFRITTHNLPSGIYFLLLFDGETTTTKKIVIQR